MLSAEKVDFEKNQQTTKCIENYAVSRVNCLDDYEVETKKCEVRSPL